MTKIECRHCKKEFFYNSIKDIPTFPFCSERCKLIDLGLWFNEEQRIEEPIKNNKIERNEN
ncbi:MAG: DNA gyrase inhibitor YacG [Candidatus Scalinduaceae bacterium]